MKKRITIIGGGIVGLATAYRLLKKSPSLELRIFEKEDRVGRHQTSNNSGVLHSGLYYKPGSLKARMAVEGIREMVAFCQAQNIPHEICGKLVVATTPAEELRLQDLRARGQANGLKGIRSLSREAMLEIEPHVGGLSALHVPEEGIVDYPQVCSALAKEISLLGGTIHLRTPVQKVRAEGPGWIMESPAGEFPADFVINCAGLHSDRVSELAGERREARIVPFRGEYYKIKPERAHLVKNLIYPVPDPQFPFLGVHFTRLIEGGVEAGPNAVLALKREGYTKRDFDLGDMADALGFPGLWRFLGRHRSMCWEEIQRSLSKKLFCASLQRLVPDVTPADLAEGGAGVRAQAMLPSGDLVQDFLLVRRPNALHVLNAPSPAATAALSIARQIIVESGL